MTLVEQFKDDSRLALTTGSTLCAVACDVSGAARQFVWLLWLSPLGEICAETSQVSLRITGIGAEYEADAFVIILSAHLPKVDAQAWVDSFNVWVFAHAPDLAGHSLHLDRWQHIRAKFCHTNLNGVNDR